MGVADGAGAARGTTVVTVFVVSFGDRDCDSDLLFFDGAFDAESCICESALSG